MFCDWSEETKSKKVMKKEKPCDTQGCTLYLEKLAAINFPN